MWCVRRHADAGGTATGAAADAVTAAGVLDCSATVVACAKADPDRAIVLPIIAATDSAAQRLLGVFLKGFSN